ncbi:hypothetical protein HUG17_7488 [Dermatophagoides farinae]|uniref:Tubulin-folding cofactor D ARM repeats domain-containing protein n=1 Tax=Dermatophagoides farinae TaxID=6954 RepID=A0A9D4SCM5_DERFA|nr:tubulin-specific chaperone D-like [Dermatophagoides farinae]KAH7637282.1 hypothetical protein HUG17_7488 [Dermatophagoides farinae]
MSHLLDPSLFSIKDKQYLKNDLIFILKFADDLLKNAKIISIDSVDDGDHNNTDNKDNIRQWLTKHEAHEEKIQKMFYNAQEEWRSVLPIVPYLMERYLQTLQMSQPKETIFDMTMDILRSLSICINPKRLARYWPTDVKWLIPVIKWTELYLDDHYDPSVHFSTANVLIIWLASAIKTPFDLSRFDRNQSDDEKTILRVEKIILKNFENYSLFSVLHLLIGSFYARHDCHNRLPDFITKLLSTIRSSDSTYSKLCALRILATLLKSVDRNRMLSHVDKIVATIVDSIDHDHEQFVKLAIKIYGRSILVHLKPSTEFKWRYRCGTRIIQELHNSSKQSSIDVENINEETEDFDQDIPDYFENLIQLMLQNLVYKSTPVRFSSAKYLSTISSRLPAEYSEQIVQHILQYCHSNSEDHYWHGSCMALAEFVRRGLVSIDSMMPDIIRIVDDALFYEQIKGSFVSGSNVRDAACYICWSMARAYDGKSIAQFVAHLAPILLNVVCFDRQLNCRRAASAVIQELAGRTQQFPHWIDVIPRTEFHSLSQIEHTYLNIGFHFAITYEEFRPTIVDNLLSQKCIHWDPAIRRLASKTVAKIANHCPFYGQSYHDKFMQQFEQMIQIDLNHQHGLMLAASYLLNADESLQKQSHVIEQLLNKFSQQFHTLRHSGSTFGNNLIRESLLVFVEKAIPFLVEKDLSEIDQFLIDSIQMIDSNELIQSAAVNATCSFMQNIPIDHGCRFLHTLISMAKPNCDHFTMSTLAQFFGRHMSSSDIKSLPDVITMVNEIIVALVKFQEYWFENEIRRPETIADIAQCLLHITSYHYDRLLQNHSDNSRLVYTILLKCFDDHTITKKGDTGLIIRRACIQSCLNYVHCIDSDQLLNLIRLITSEAASNRGFTFRLSMQKLVTIFHFIRNDSRHHDLCQSLGLESNRILKLDNEIDSIEDLQLFQELLNLFHCDKLVIDLWRGLVLIVADPNLERHCKCIIDYIKDCRNDIRQKLLEQYLILAEANARCLRLSIPLLISMNTILIRLETCRQFQDNAAKFAWRASEKTSNPRKYFLACDIFCTLLVFGRINLVQGYLYVLLGHRLAVKIRSYTATQMYAAILSLDIDEPEKLSEIAEILQQTDWLELNEAKRERDKIRNLMKELPSS